jgi:hypothetical protein
MIADDNDNFISRWSRRKIEARKAEEKPAEPKPSSEPAAPEVSNAGTAASPAVPRELPPVDSLQGLASEYKDFLRPGVDPKLQQAALKKLFHDPHFNIMDGLDTYIDDYSKPDPIPDEMLKALKQANRMIFPEEAAEKDREIEEAARKAVADAEAAPAAETPPLQVALDDERVAPEPESQPAEDSKPPAKPA